MQLLHDLDQLGAVGRGQAAPLVQNKLQLCAGELVKVQLHKAVPEGSGEHLQDIGQSTVNPDNVKIFLMLNPNSAVVLLALIHSH